MAKLFPVINFPVKVPTLIAVEYANDVELPRWSDAF